MGRTTAMWAMLLVLSTWPYGAIAQVHGYVGARGEFDYSISHPGFNNNEFRLSDGMLLEGGIYQIRSQRNLMGIGIGATISTSQNEHYVESEGSFGEDNPFVMKIVHDEFNYRYYRDWFFPVHAELQYMRFPGGEVGAGRYYLASIRTAQSYMRLKNDWQWGYNDAYNLSFHLGAGYGWKVGTSNNVRLEGQFIWRGEWYVFQAAMNFGRWW